MFTDAQKADHQWIIILRFTFWKGLWRIALSLVCITVSTLLFHEIGFQAKLSFMFHISKLLNCSMIRVTGSFHPISLLLAKRLSWWVFSCDFLKKETCYILLEKLLSVATSGCLCQTLLHYTFSFKNLMQKYKDRPFVLPFLVFFIIIF